MDNLLLAFSDVQIRPKVGFAPAAVIRKSWIMEFARWLYQRNPTRSDVKGSSLIEILHVGGSEPQKANSEQIVGAVSVIAPTSRGVVGLSDIPIGAALRLAGGRGTLTSQKPIVTIESYWL